MVKKLVLTVLVLVFLVEIYVLLKMLFFVKDYNVNGEDVLIGHAFYEIDGDTYTNSKEAFLEGYKNGLRIFEVDCILTKDDKVVLAHGWGEDDYMQEIPTEEEFLKTKILGKYTPMSFKDLLNLMEEYPDITIVTDSKYTNAEYVTKEFNYILEEARKLDKVNLLDRFIIQIYNEEMYDTLQGIYPFKNIIFTLYKRWEGDIEEFKTICDWSNKHNIKTITMWDFLCTDEILNIAKEYNLNICVHTENDINSAVNFLNNGVYAIYTDNIKANDIFKNY